MAEPLFTADGKEVEGAMTTEEVKTQLEEKLAEAEKTRTEGVETLTKAHGEKTTELQGKIDELTETMEKLGDKDQNFAKLRKKKEENEEILKKVDEKYQGEIAGIRAEVREEKLNTAINAIVGEDKEVAEKVKLHYGNFKGEPKDRKEMIERIQNAYILATGSKPESLLNSDIIKSGGGSPPNLKDKGGKVSEDGKAVAEKMGISEEELKKHKLL